VRAIEALRTESRLPGPDLSIPAGPLRIDGDRPDPGSPAPRLGQHTDEVLAEFGFSLDERRALSAAGAFGR